MRSISELKIKDKILVFILFLTLFPTVILSGFIFLEEFNLANQSADLSETSLRSEEIANLQRITTDKALFVEETFKKIDNDLEFLQKTSIGLFQGTIYYDSQQSYFWDYSNPNVGPVPGLANDDDYGEPVSYETSAWYIPNSEVNSTLNNIPVLDNETEYYLNTSAKLNTAFQSLYEGNSNYFWIYAGFQSAGLFRIFPYVDLATFITYNNSQGYDVRQTFYYKGAFQSSLTYFSNPYPEEGGDSRIITASRPIIVNNEFIGIVAIDIGMESILADFINIKVKDSGYAFLLSDDASVIAHPYLSFENYEEKISSLESEDQSFSEILTSIDTKDEGNDLYKKNGQNWLIYYKTIGLTGYFFAVVVPESEILQPAFHVKNSILSSTLFIMGILVIIVGFILVLVIFGSKLTSNAIIKPIEDLTTAMNYITDGNLEQKDQKDYSKFPREIGQFQHSFDNFVVMLQYGNMDYFQNNLFRAYQTYSRALTIFQDADNKKGMGICQSYLAKIERLWGNSDKSRKLCSLAIQTAKDTGDIKALGSRFNSMGILYLDENNISIAKSYFEDSLVYNRKAQNIKGEASVLCNLGLLYMNNQEDEKALESYNSAIEIAKEHFHNGALAFSYLNKATFLLKYEDLEDASNLLALALDLSRITKDVRLASNILETQAQISTRRGDKENSLLLQTKSASLSGKRKQNKRIVFVLDLSSSMSGTRIDAAKSGLLELYKKQASSEDKVGLVGFHNDPFILQKLEINTRLKKKFPKLVKSLNIGGMTAFYDALAVGVKELVNDSDKGSQNWIVALTDGEDNRSYDFTITASSKNSIQSFVKSLDFSINFIVIGVGLSNPVIQEELVNLCEVTPISKYIAITDAKNAELTIKEAYKEAEAIIAKTAVEDLEEFRYED